MLEISWTGNCELALTGRFDASRTDIALIEFDKISKSTTINMRQLDYISSAGLGVLVATHQRLRESGEGLTLCCMNQHIRNIFRLTGLEKLFIIE